MQNDALLKQLQQETKGLRYTSESDAPIQPFVWPKADVGAAELTPDTVQKYKHLPSGQKAQEVKFADFFQPLTESQSWYGPEEKATMQAFQTLVNTLQSNLTDLKVFQFGDAKKEVYIVGKTASGDYAGVHTQAVET